MDGIRRGFVLSQQSIDELLDIVDSEVFTSSDAKIYKRYDNDSSWRVTERVDINYTIFPDVCEEIENWVGDGTKVRQLDLLIYNVGSRFREHTDNGGQAKQRIHSTSTLLEISDDLVGGDLVLYEDGELNGATNVELKVGETVLFDSLNQWHEVTEVTQGKRICLVAWLKNS